MIPFLKKRNELAAVLPADVIERKPDDESEEDFDMLDAVAEDLLHAIEKKDKGLLKGALSAFCEHIMDLDQEQDEQTMKGQGND